MFRFRKRAPATAAPARPGAASGYGGMQVRELQTRMELLVNPTRAAQAGVHEAALALAGFGLAQQRRFLSALERIARVDVALARAFCSAAPRTLGLVADDDWQRWIDHLLATQAARGTAAAGADIERFARTLRQARDGRSGVAFADVAAVLAAFVRGLNGTPLPLAASDDGHADPDALRFPERIDDYPERELNFRLYKARAVHQWAQTRFGGPDADTRAALDAFPDRAHARTLLHRLETLRLDACIARELPGLARDMTRFRPPLESYPDAWREAAARLAAPGAGVQDSVRWLARLYGQDWQPPPAAYERILERAAARAPAAPPKRTARDAERAGDAGRLPEASAPPPDRADPTAGESAGEDAADHREDGVLYDEWDASCRSYRKHWCRVREETVAAMPNGFRAETLVNRRALVMRLRRGFELLRQEANRTRRLPHGEDIDLDALVEALADARHGREMSERLFTATRRERRHVAALFLLDMSASTRGWINRVEREALILLCDAMERLDDRYAIFGFSGSGRRRCLSYPVKGFADAYDARIGDRIGGLQPQRYTRMGVAIRHHARQLLAQEARTRLLVLLSDGRPDDLDGYRDAYAIEDTRMALLEARAAGVHPFCITIDRDARDYLPHMFGHNGFAVIDAVERLPQRLADIYRTLTT